MTERDVAQWMLKEFEQQGGWLEQITVVHDVERIFGEKFVISNDSGNLVFTRKVLTNFRSLTKDFVVWDSVEKAWRRRDATDTPGKRLVDRLAAR